MPSTPLALLQNITTSATSGTHPNCPTVPTRLPRFTMVNHGEPCLHSGSNVCGSLFRAKKLCTALTHFSAQELLSIHLLTKQGSVSVGFGQPTPATNGVLGRIGGNLGETVVKYGKSMEIYHLEISLPYFTPFKCPLKLWEVWEKSVHPDFSGMGYNEHQLGIQPGCHDPQSS